MTSIVNRVAVTQRFHLLSKVGTGVIFVPQCAWLLKYGCGTVVAMQDFISYIYTCDITQEELSRNDIVAGMYNSGQNHWILIVYAFIISRLMYACLKYFFP